MTFKSLVIVFQEDHACRDPYYMGFSFDGNKFILKGEFNKTDMIQLCKDREISWGESGGIASYDLANLLLEDCLGKKASHALVSKLNRSLLLFPHGNGIVWILWEEDLKKWANFPNYGILPREGYISALENDVLTIHFPVPGVTYNQIG